MTCAYRLPADSCRNRPQSPTPNDHLASAFLAHLRAAGASGPLGHYLSSSRHFLFWLSRQGIPISGVNSLSVDRFARHRCHCSRYSGPAHRVRDYVGRVRRFVRFLEDRGDIPVVPDVDHVDRYLVDFATHLQTIGYSLVTQRGHRSEAEHFTVWLRTSCIRWHDVDDSVIGRFGEHNCNCPIWRKRGQLVEPTGSAHRRRGARRFIAFLRDHDAIAPAGKAPLLEEPSLSAFRHWLKQHRGATDATIRRYTQEALRWLPTLATGSANREAATIRGIVLDQGPQRSRTSIRMTVTVLRTYLRFLATQGECRPELAHAVPPAPRRRLETLPRYVSPETIERIIASCSTTTPIGVRDRAITLLLARLGLRAGDVWRMQLGDFDWANALLRVHGKERRPIHLPLPQDVGDAVLAYLEGARPLVRAEPRMFLRTQAPFTPFSSASEIAGIVARVLARGDIEGVPSGAHVFRHSLATTMLRAGASLESVGTVLRHRSANTTAIYAKVDVAMLERVAQPWLGDASC